MYFNYFYDLVDCGPEEEVTKYYLPIIAHHLRGDAAPRRLDRPPPRHRQGARAVGERGVRLVVPVLETLKQRVRPERDHEQGHDHPHVNGGPRRSTTLAGRGLDWQLAATGVWFFENPLYPLPQQWSIRWVFPNGQSCNSQFTVT